MQLNQKIILGSSSPWRKQVMIDLGLEFEVVAPDIDEKAIRSDNPAELVKLIGEAKNKAVQSKVSELAIIITSDQVAVCNGEMREKPVDEREAREFLESYREFPVETVTSVCVYNTENRKMACDVDKAKVFFKFMSDDTIDMLIKDGMVMKACGAFYRENLMAPFVDRIEGEDSSISGLPISLLLKLIEIVKLPVYVKTSTGEQEKF